MVVLKILGAIDLAAALAFLMLVFGLSVFTQFLLFSSGLIFFKGLFSAFTWDILGFVDLFAALMLLLAIFFTLPSILLWVPCLLLFSKGLISFF